MLGYSMNMQSRYYATPESGRTKPPRSRLKKWLLFSLLALILIGGTVALVSWNRWNSEPEYYQPITQIDEQTERHAQRFFMFAISDITKPREPDEVWELQVDQTQLNEWLATGMPGWLLEGFAQIDIPEWAVDPMIVFRDGQIILASRVTYEDFEQVVSAASEPRVEANGQLSMQLDWVKGGNLTVPSGGTADRFIRQFGDEETQEKARAKLDEMRHVTVPPMQFDDGRLVQILDMTVHNESATLKCRTLPNKNFLANGLREP